MPQVRHVSEQREESSREWPFDHCDDELSKWKRGRECDGVVGGREPHVCSETSQMRRVLEELIEHRQFKIGSKR